MPTYTPTFASTSTLTFTHTYTPTFISVEAPRGPTSSPTSDPATDGDTAILIIAASAVGRAVAGAIMMTRNTGISSSSSPVDVEGCSPPQSTGFNNFDIQTVAGDVVALSFT
jgi:hypothetical protein